VAAFGRLTARRPRHHRCIFRNKTTDKENRMNRIFIAAALLSTLLLAGCNRSSGGVGPAQQAGKAIDDAGARAQAKVEEAGAKVQGKIDQANEKIEQINDKVTDKVQAQVDKADAAVREARAGAKEASEKVGRKVEEAGEKMQQAAK
jgi:predicted small secreted protein